jgi:hypothetical protein
MTRSGAKVHATPETSQHARRILPIQTCRMSSIQSFLSRSSPLLFMSTHYLLTFYRQDLLPILSQFKNLEELVLAKAAYLGVGFKPPWCGNAYSGPNGQEIRRRVKEQEQQARNDVVRAVLGSCTGLKRLWVGDWECTELKGCVEDGGRTDIENILRI